MFRENSLAGKMISGFPYLLKEIRASISSASPWFIARPRMVYLLFVNMPCNGRCIMCPSGIRNAGGVAPEGEHVLSEEEMLRIVREVGRLCGRGTLLSFTGGEPLICGSLLKMMEESRGNGVDFSFTTNGYRLDADTVEKVVAQKPLGIGVSLESLDPAVNEVLRAVPGGTEKTVQGIELLLSAKERYGLRLIVNIKPVVTQVNLAAIPEIVRAYGKRGGVMITPQPFHCVPGLAESTIDKLWVSDIPALKKTVEELLELKRQGFAVNADEQTLLDLVSYFEKKSGCCGGRNGDVCARQESQETSRRCVIGHTSLFVKGAGDVYLCPDMAAIGNIRDGLSLEQMWFGPEARQRRREIAGCRKVCTLSCTRSSSLWNKMKMFLK